MERAPAKAPPLAVNSRLEKFFASVEFTHGRVIIAIDATASRQATWEMATKLQSKMFEAITGLNVQVACYRGEGELIHSDFVSEPRALVDFMRPIRCKSGYTQIGRVLQHARQENHREQINALVLISDACEEPPGVLYDAARALRLPAFCFQEGDDNSVSAIYHEIARLTGGAVARFDAGAAGRLSDLLKAVAAFATGGAKALAEQRTEAARLLLTQIRK
jgi:hypothetical protein